MQNLTLWFFIAAALAAEDLPEPSCFPLPPLPPPSHTPDEEDDDEEDDYYELPLSPGGNPMGWWYDLCRATAVLSPFTDPSRFLDSLSVLPGFGSLNQLLSEKLVLAVAKSYLVRLELERLRRDKCAIGGVAPFWGDLISEDPMLIPAPFGELTIRKLPTLSSRYDRYHTDNLYTLCLEGTVCGGRLIGTFSFFNESGSCAGDWIDEIVYGSFKGYLEYLLTSVKELKFKVFEMNTPTTVEGLTAGLVSGFKSFYSYSSEGEYSDSEADSEEDPPRAGAGYYPDSDSDSGSD